MQNATLLSRLSGLRTSLCKTSRPWLSSLLSHLLALPYHCSVIEPAGPILQGINSDLANDEVVDGQLAILKIMIKVLNYDVL